MVGARERRRRLRSPDDRHAATKKRPTGREATQRRACNCSVNVRPAFYRHAASLQITIDNPSVNTSAVTEIIVSHTVQVLNVCVTVMPKYSLTSQNPPSFTCDRISDPAPVASTSSSGRTPVAVEAAAAAIGATIPAAVAMATVADPVATRIKPATSHARISSGTCAPVATSTIALDAPLSIRMRPKPAPAPTTSVMLAVGARHSFVNLRIDSRLNPRAEPNV